MFDLLHFGGEDLAKAPLLDRKDRLEQALNGAPSAIRYSSHVAGNGAAFLRQAARMRLEGVVSKRSDRPYRPGNRGDWVKAKCLNREEFVIVGWTDPEGARPHLGALLLGYHTPERRLVYAGRVGAGMKRDELQTLWQRLQPLATKQMPLGTAPPRTNRFGSPLVLSRVHWVRPELVVEVSYLSWTDDNLLRQAVYEGIREDKQARNVVRADPSNGV